MKPKPLSSLNHLTVPVAICFLSAPLAGTRSGSHTVPGKRGKPSKEALAPTRRLIRGRVGGAQRPLNCALPGPAALIAAEPQRRRSLPDPRGRASTAAEDDRLDSAGPH